MAAAVRPEEALLLHCARLCVRSGSVERLAEPLQQVGDWDYLFRLASRHAVTPMVAHALSRPSAPQVPPSVLERLRAESRAAASRSLHQTATLRKLLKLFEASSIPAVPFKGPVVASMLYGDAALRDSVDLDILIRREDVPLATKMMVANGYHTDLPIGAAQRAAYLRARHELHFTSGTSSILVEIHQAFLPPFCCFTYDYSLLWERLERRTFWGSQILTLPTEDLLLSLCAHATKHAWSRLGWICDVARLLVVSGETIDWNRIISQGSALGARRMLLLGVALAQGLLDAPVPREVLRRAEQDYSAGHLVQAVVAALFDPHDSSDLRAHLFFLRARERARDRLSYCARLAFTPTEEDHSLLRLPLLLSPLYFPLHAIRVTGKYGWACFRGASNLRERTLN